MSNYENSIKLCYWNIGGLNVHGTNKLNDHFYIKEIQEYDVVILAETHIGYSTPVFVEQFNCFSVCRDISSNGRYYGGLAILRRKELKDHIKILSTTCKDYQWLKFDKNHFHLQSDLYLCALYMPPANSTYTRHLPYDILELIEKDLLYYKEKGDVLICGDFNARTADKLDVITDDTSKYLPLFDSYSVDNTTRVRRSHDTVIDTRGKELLEFCIQNQLRIMNGRCLGDIFGHYTCFNPLGQSTVDYLLASEKITNQLLYFKVSEFIPTLSDCHCKISWEILAKFQHSLSTRSEEKLHKVPINYTWTEGSDTRFQEALNSPNIQSKINNFLFRADKCTHEKISELISDFENIILSSADLSLKKPKFKNKNKDKNKKWLDADLGKIKCEQELLLKVNLPKTPLLEGTIINYTENITN